MSISGRLSVCAVLSPTSLQLSAQNEGLFPFQPTHDAPLNITNVNTWNTGVAGAGTPAGSQGFIRSSADRFVDGDGNERRFIGTNICFTGCFPEKADADRLSAELSRYGINVVRLHYVHHKTPPGNVYPQPNSFIEPVQLDKFDYLFAKLKEKGIYTYFQLNIARKFSEANGFVNASKLPFMKNGIDNYDYRMIALQKKYIKEILEHKNPYTGLAYKDDAAISMMELANENSVVASWFSFKHNMPYMIEPYRTELKDKWNKYLEHKYADTRTIKQAWGEALKGDGSEQLPDGVFREAYPDMNWGIQTDRGGIAAWRLKEAGPKDKLTGKYYAAIRVDELGPDKNRPIFFRKGISSRANTPYCLKMKLRADNPLTLQLRFAQAHSPFQLSGLSQQIEVGRTWKEYEFNFVNQLDDDNLRLLFLGFQPGELCIADVSMVEGINFEWPAGQSIEAGNIEWPTFKEWNSIPQRAYDFVAFLAGLESYYFSDMRMFVLRNVTDKQPVTGTQMLYGLSKPQAMMDFCDVHNYWCHPIFPRNNWDENSIEVPDKSMSNGDAMPGSNLMSIARTRVLGRPLTISEYDNPNLNYYSAEGNLMATALGAFQNWSAFLQFAWTHNQEYFRDWLSPQFDMCSSTAKLVHFPACYAMFVRGDVKRGDDSIVFARKLSEEDEIRKIAEAKSVYATATEKNPVMSYLPLAVVTGKEMADMPSLYNAEGRTIIRTLEDVPQAIREQFKNKEVTSTSGEITWNWQMKGAGYFKVDTPRTKVFSGFVRGRSFNYEGMILSPGATKLDWLTLSLTQAVGSAGTSRETLAPGRYLLSVTGLVQNTGEVVVKKGKNLSCGSNYGGSRGNAPVLCEGIMAELLLKGLGGRVECFALDQAGEHKARVQVDGSADALVHLSPEYETVWYELVIR